MNKPPLILSRRFAPLFFAQWGGAFNDNFFKSALLILFTFKGLELGGMPVNVVNNLVSATLILPFLIFAALASQYADKFEKSALIRALKLAELIVMAGAAVALWLGNAWLMLLALFCMGVQSACFSPLKYAILPQHVASEELVAANGLLHVGTSLAIFMGLIGGSVAAQLPSGVLAVAIGGICIALLGYWASRKIPVADSAAPDLKLQHNPFKQYWRSLSHAMESAIIFWSIIGISWYWFLGSVFLTQLPNLIRSVLGAAPAAVPVFLLIFLIGVCIGAILTNRLSRGRVEPALVPLGGVLISLVAFDLYWAAQSYSAAYVLSADLIGLAELFSRFEVMRVLIDFSLLGAVGGLFIVPLAALLQERTQAQSRAQVVGANNFFNAIFMIAAALAGVFLLGVFGFSIAEFFAITAIVNILVVALMLIRVAEFWQRFRRRFFQAVSN